MIRLRTLVVALALLAAGCLASSALLLSSERDQAAISRLRRGADDRDDRKRLRRNFVRELAASVSPRRPVHIPGALPARPRPEWGFEVALARRTR